MLLWIITILKQKNLSKEKEDTKENLLEILKLKEKFKIF